MIVFVDKKRSEQPETMDGTSLKGMEMRSVLADIRRVNKWLGGNAVTLNGIEKLLPRVRRPITIVDLGCGDGEMLRQIYAFGKRKGHDFKLIGIDFNPHIIEEAEQKSSGISKISFQTADVLSKSDFPKGDIFLATLFLHHLSQQQIIVLLKKTRKNAKLGMVINDLHRHRLAFWLFKLICPFLLKTKTGRNDGLVSIARGFKKHELHELACELPVESFSLSWKWAFRYQLIIRKHKWT